MKHSICRIVQRRLQVAWTTNCLLFSQGVANNKSASPVGKTRPVRRHSLEIDPSISSNTVAFRSPNFEPSSSLALYGKYTRGKQAHLALILTKSNPPSFKYSHVENLIHHTDRYVHSRRGFLVNKPCLQSVSGRTLVRILPAQSWRR